MGATLIFVLLSLSTFGVESNPNAPSAAEVVKYAPDDADLMMHVDLEPILAPNWSKLQALPDMPAIKANAQVRRVLQEGIQKIEMIRAMARSGGKVDPVTDLKSATLFVPSLGKQHSGIAVIRGTFPADLIDLAGKQLRATPIKISGRSMIMMPGDGTHALALVDANTVLIGNAALVKARLGNWKPRVTKGAAKITGFYDSQKPFYLIAIAPSAATRKTMLAKAKRGSADEGEQVAIDILGGAEYGAFWLRSNGVGWTLTARTPAGFTRASDFSEGMLSMMRANHHVTRGMARWFLAALPSFGKQFAGVAKYRGDLIKLIETWTGDGNFPATTDAQAAKRTVTVIATGKSLSDVLPVGGLVPMGAGFFLMMGTKSSSHMSGPVHKSPTPVRTKHSDPSSTRPRPPG